MSKYISPDAISGHVKKMQGNVNDTAFAKTLGITRQALRTITSGKAIPNIRTRGKLGLELCYRVVDPVNPDAAKVEVAAPKPAAKTAKKK